MPVLNPIYPVGGAVSYRQTFTAADWSGAGGITIPAAKHGITGSNIVYQLQTLIAGEYVTGTWAELETKVSIDSSTNAVTISRAEAYDGAIILMG